MLLWINGPFGGGKTQSAYRVGSPNTSGPIG